MTWETVRVGEIAQQIRGVTYSKDEASAVPLDEHVAILRAGNVGNDGLVFDDLVHVPSARVNDRQYLRPNDVLVATSSGSLSVVGKAARVVDPVNASFGAFCKVLRPISNIHPGYFAHYFRTADYRRYISSVAAGANINNLRGGDLDRIEMPLPPLAEQRRIAAILDEADQLRSRSSKLDAGLASTVRHLVDGVCREAVGSIELGRHIAASRNGLYVPQSAYGAGTPIVRIDSFDGMTPGFLGDLKRVKLSEQAQMRFAIEPRNILINRVNALSHLGKSILVPHLEEPTVFESNMMQIELHEEEVLPEFVAAWLTTDDARAQIRRRAKKAINQASINQADVAALMIPVVARSTQMAWLRMSQEATSLQATSGARSARVGTLFASLQHRAFRGEL